MKNHIIGYSRVKRLRKATLDVATLHHGSCLFNLHTFVLAGMSLPSNNIFFLISKGRVTLRKVLSPIRLSK